MYYVVGGTRIMWLQNGNFFQFVWVGLQTLGIKIQDLKDVALHASHWAPHGYSGDSYTNWSEHPIIRVYTLIPWDENLVERSNGLDRHGLSFQVDDRVVQGPCVHGRQGKSYGGTLADVAEALELDKKKLSCVVEFHGPRWGNQQYPELRVFLGDVLTSRFSGHEVTTEIACGAIKELWPQLALGKDVHLSVPTLPEHDCSGIED